MGSSYVGEARVIKSTLSIYEKASGQAVNRAKSSIFFFNTPEARQKRLLIFLVVRLGHSPLPI